MRSVVFRHTQTRSHFSPALLISSHFLEDEKWGSVWKVLLCKAQHRDHVPGNSPQLPARHPPLACPCEVTTLFQVVNESCQTKSHFKSTLCKKKNTVLQHISFINYAMDQGSKQQKSQCTRNGTCGYLNPWSPLLECNSLGKNSFPDFSPTHTRTHTHTHTPIIQKRVITQHQTCMMQLLGLLTFQFYETWSYFF